VGSIIVVGLVSLLAISPSLELISSMINFGALVAFTFVNLSVIAYFVWRRREYRTIKQVATNLVLPLVGTAMTGILWSFLHKDALIAGIVWAVIGVIYAVVIHRVTGRRVTDVPLDENALPSDASSEPTLVAV
jgi:putrescine importer